MGKEMVLDDKNFEPLALGSKKTILVDFWAEWCMPCKAQEPILKELASEGYKIGKLNVDENPETASQYGVRSIPTLIIFKNGEPVEQMVGVRGKQEIKSKLDKWSKN